MIFDGSKSWEVIVHVFADVSFSGMVCCKMVEECDFTSAILLRISSIAGCRVVGGGRSTCFLKFGPFFNWIRY